MNKFYILVLLIALLLLTGCTSNDNDKKLEVETKDLNNDPTVVTKVTEKEKQLFLDQLNVQFSGLSYSVEEQIKLYKVYILTNGLVDVKQQDIDNTNRYLNDINSRLNNIRTINIPNDQELQKEYNDLLLSTDTLYTALQKGVNPLQNNFIKQLSGIFKDEIEPAKNGFDRNLNFLNVENAIQDPNGKDTSTETAENINTDETDIDKQKNSIVDSNTNSVNKSELIRNEPIFNIINGKYDIYGVSIGTNENDIRLSFGEPDTEGTPLLDGDWVLTYGNVEFKLYQGDVIGILVSTSQNVYNKEWYSELGQIFKRIGNDMHYFYQPNSNQFLKFENHEENVYIHLMNANTEY